MVQNIFKGLGIALITPFTQDGQVDYPALIRLVNYQLDNGADFFCILATTGETPCLTADEKVAIKQLVVKLVAGRIPIVMGCGGNNTAAVVEELKNTDWSGIDGILSVCPYYNKPSQEGLYQHFKAIAKASPLPVILYNVPGRTGINLKAETVKQIYPEIFDWIALFDTNVSVLLIITTCVCMITMMSVFFIIVLGQTRLIGILKTLGMKTKHVVQTFLMVAARTLFKGLLVGNAIGLGFGWLQQATHLIKLNPDTYYVNYVPIKFQLWEVILLNLGVFAACMLVLVVPAWIIAKKISPVKAVQFE